MSIEPQHPEIPWPLPPERPPPRRTEPLAVPMVPIPTGDPWRELASQRRILVSGSLDDDAVTTLTARLLALDGESSRDVELVVNSDGGPVAAILPALDTIDVMRARTDTTCIGTAGGTAAALVACGTGTRRAAPNATLCLRIDDLHVIEGSTSAIVRRADELGALRARLIVALAAATELDAERLNAEIDHGRRLSADEACRLGIIDRVERRAADDRS